MMNWKKFVSILLACTMTVGVAACGDAGKGQSSSKEDDAPTVSVETPTIEEEYAQPLEIVKGDISAAHAQLASRIKAEYLIEHGGYREGDEVIAILSLKGNALIDDYLANEELKAKSTLGEYAASPTGKQRSRVIASEQADLIRTLQSEGLIKEVEYRYDVILNAVAVKTTYGNFLKFGSVGGVSSVTLSDTFSRPQETGDTDASAIENVVDVYETGIFNSSTVDYTGVGTSVAVLDSGFDCSHAVFNTHTLDRETLMFQQSDIRAKIPDTNAKKTTPGLDLADVWYSNKIPFTYDYADKDTDPFPYDSEHGTHVAGIIGGYADQYTKPDGTIAVDENGDPIPFKGIAKDTQLVLMKVFPDLQSGAETDDILAALEDAVLLEVDAINMSLGASCGFAREADGDRINEVYDKLAESGVSLITAASNSFSSGYGGAQGNTNFVTNPDSGTVGSPSTYAGAFSVASISGVKSKYLVGSAADGSGKQNIFFNESNSVAGKENDFFAELIEDATAILNNPDPEKPAPTFEYDQATDTWTFDYVTVPGYGYRANYNTIDVNGKIALVRRGDTTFEDKAAQAKAAGAIACIIYNNVDGDILMSMGKTDHVPTISISKDDGTSLAARPSGKLIVKSTNQAGPFMSDFSSWGPLPDLTLKPEITAHGGNILSSVPGGGFEELSGTSMATPNLCGIVVLIRQFLKEQERYQDSSWKEISNLANEMLMSTATIVLNEEGNPYSPRKQGAGLASLYNVVNTSAYLTVDGKDRPKIELGDDAKKTGVYEMTFNVVNISDKAVSYDLDLVGMTESVSSSDAEHVAEKSQILGGNFTATKVGGDGTLTGNKVTVEAGKTLSLKVVYTLTGEDKNMIEELFPYGMYVEGFVKLAASEEGGIDLNIPFLGFYGDWTQAPIFDKSLYDVDADAHDSAIDEDDKVKADYYATTPFGSYHYNYMIPLGQYLYEIDTSAYDYIPASAEHAAVSDLLGCVDGIYTVYAGLLRSCKTMIYSITDTATGEEVYHLEKTNARKAYSEGGSPIPNFEELLISAFDLQLVNNRKYEFKMTGLLDYGEDGGLTTNVKNTFSFEFYMDNEAPVIKDATYEKEYDKSLRKDRYYITLTVHDNQYVQSIAPVGFNASNSYTYITENPIPVYSERGQDSTVRIEITDFLEELRFDQVIGSAICFIVDDYALNQNLFVCRLPGTQGGFKFTNNGEWDGGSKMSQSVRVGQIVDLTQFLATQDDTVDEGKDYLKYLTWTSSNPRIAQVDEGQVVGIAAGRATITVTANYPMLDLPIQTTSIIVTVTAPSATATVKSEEGLTISPLSQNDVPDINDASIRSLRFAYLVTEYAFPRGASTENTLGSAGNRVYLSTIPGALSFYPGESFRLYYDLDPWYVADKYTLTFKSSNPNVATVDEKTGLVRGVAKGSATITLEVTGIDGRPSNVSARLRLSVQSEFIIDEARTLVGYKGTGGDVVIPDDEGILYIGPFAFCLYDTNYQYEGQLPDDDFDANKTARGNNNVTSVTIPAGVTEIQKYAFYNCSKLEKVTIEYDPKTSPLKFIREYAFMNDVNLKEINLDRVEAIGRQAFYGCTSLGMDKKFPAAGNTTVTEKTIDLSKAYSLGDRAFYGCTALTYIDLSALRNAGVEVFMNTSSLKKAVLGENTKLSRGIFANSGLQSVDLYLTNVLPEQAFAHCASLASVTFHSDFVSIGANAFAECENLETVDFGSHTVESIGTGAFCECPKLTTITLPNCAFTLGEAVFYQSKLQTVILGAETQFTSALNRTFADTELATFNADSSNHYKASEDGKYLLTKDGTTLLFAVKGIDDEITIPATVTSIGTGAFSGSSVKKVTFEAAGIRVGGYAFADCPELTTVVFNANTTDEASIGEMAFVNCVKLASVENLDKVKSVGAYAFAVRTQAQGTNALTAVTIGEGAKYGEGAFFRSGLTSVTIGKDASFDLGVFQYSRLTTVNMPEAGGVQFGRGCFAYATSLQSIDMSKADGTVPEQCFFGCTSLSSVNLHGVTDIGFAAFADCARLAELQNLDAVVTIGESAFARGTESGAAPSFMALTLPNTLTSIGEGAFFGCEGFTEVSIPTSVTELGDAVFEMCIGLETVVLPDNLKVLPEFIFMGCANLASINLEHVETIGAYAFASMYALATLNGSSTSSNVIHVLEDVDLSSAKTIGEAAFAGSLVTTDIDGANLEEIGAYAFMKVNNSSYQGVVHETVKSVTAPNLKIIGEGAFEGNVTLEEVNFSEGLAFIDIGVFSSCTALKTFTFGTEKKTDGAINDYAKLVGGVLYTKLPNGKWQLSSVPAGKEDTTLEVAEGTYRVDDFSGNENTHVTNLIFPDSLAYIGNYAFFGYTSLSSVEFRSIQAPVLESLDVNIGSSLNYTLEEGDPGYDLLKGQVDVFGLTPYYFNFVDQVGKKQPISMVLPSNEDIEGYDSLIYLVYFGPVEEAARSGHIAMEQAMKDFLDYAAAVRALDKIKLSDETLIGNAVTALNAIKQDPTQFGYEKAEWDELVTIVTEARTTLAHLKLDNAKKSIRDLQARIDSLPDTFDGSDSQRAMYEALAAEVGALSVEDRLILIRDKLNAFRESIEAYDGNGGSSGGDPETPPSGGNGGGLSTGAIIGITVGAVAAVGIAAVIALYFLNKRKGGVATDEENDGGDDENKE